MWLADNVIVLEENKKGKKIKKQENSIVFLLYCFIVFLLNVRRDNIFHRRPVAFAVLGN